MSTTPRTDEQTLAYRTEDGSEMVHASFAAELETELAAMQARAELAEASAKLWEADALRYANNTEFWKDRAERAEADTARLDWLDENMGYSGGGSGGTYTFFTPADVECGMLRDAIDAAMKEANQ